MSPAGFTTTTWFLAGEAKARFLSCFRGQLCYCYCCLMRGRRQQEDEGGGGGERLLLLLVWGRRCPRKSLRKVSHNTVALHWNRKRSCKMMGLLLKRVKLDAAEALEPPSHSLIFPVLHGPTQHCNNGEKPWLTCQLWWICATDTLNRGQDCGEFVYYAQFEKAGNFKCYRYCHDELKQLCRQS